MSGESEYLRMSFEQNADHERRYCQLNKGELILQLLIQSKERMRKRKLNNQLDERWERIKCEACWTKDKRKVFVKDKPISNVWKLLDGRNIQLKNWRKQIGKERNYRSRRLYTLKMHVFDRKRELLRAWSWDLINDRRDLMER